MEFSEPLVRGVLERRYKRFLADVKLEDGEVVVAHCANSGSMLGVKEPGSEVWLSRSTNPKRKLKYTWEFTRCGDHLVGVNTGHPNALVADAILDGTIGELPSTAELSREKKYGKNSRIDILLEDENGKTYVEVKNVHMSREDGLAEFPDSVTTRGAKHLVELSDMVAEGHRSVMVYLVQREDCDRFTIAGDIDPGYAEALIEARGRGVEAVCYCCKVTPSGISVDRPLPIVF